MSPPKKRGDERTYILRLTAPIENLKLNRPLLRKRQIRRIMEVEPIPGTGRQRLFFRIQPEETVTTFTTPPSLRSSRMRPIKVTAVKFDSEDEAMLDIILGVRDGDQD